jgi:transcriptional regulator with XRE-family HTH domain
MQPEPLAAAEPSSPGQLVRAARLAIGLTKEKLAYEAEVSLSTISRLELQDQLPATLPLARIAARLQIPVEQLLPEELRVTASAAAASP